VVLGPGSWTGNSVLAGIVSDGLSELLIQYFKLLFNFSVADVVCALSSYLISRFPKWCVLAHCSAR